MFRKVTIIGVGLIGGSIGKALKKHNLAREVVGLSQRHTTLELAIKDKVIDQAYNDVGKAVFNADLVILATPVSVITGMMSMIGPHLKRGCIVTDVGSTKVPIVSAAEEHLPNPAFFVGSHPLAGSEKRGVENATEDLFKGSLCIMTPTQNTHRTARDRVSYLWTQLGARVKFLSPEDHDKILAYISHLPHLMAYALMDTIPEEGLEFAATGLKDTTRIAASSPQLWTDICLNNSKNLISSLDQLVLNLGKLRKAITSGDQKTLIHHFKSAKGKRDKIE